MRSEKKRNSPRFYSSKWQEFTHIRGFTEHFRLVGGMNVPKLIECLGSDAKKYLQLVKGNDDLRQDAVMQQMFSLVNRCAGKNFFLFSARDPEFVQFELNAPDSQLDTLEIQLKSFFS
jgi:hypothetical protein